MNLYRKLRHGVELSAVRLLLLVVRILPLRLSRPLGAFLGWWAFCVLRIRRGIVVENISRSLGGSLGRREAASIGARSYANLGRSLVEFVAFAKLSGEQIADMVSIVGLDHLDEALSRGRGGIFLTGHFGSWELMGAAIARYGYPVHFLVGEQTNKMVDRVMNELRAAQGIGIISRHFALRKVMRELANNQIVALLADQDAGKSGVFVQFFGRPASTFKGPAQFAIKQSCPIIPAFIVRRSGGKHLAVIEELIWPDTKLEKDASVRELTQRYTRVLEEYIRKHPDHYFWPHRRWKTRKQTT